MWITEGVGLVSVQFRGKVITVFRLNVHYRSYFQVNLRRLSIFWKEDPTDRLTMWIEIWSFRKAKKEGPGRERQTVPFRDSQPTPLAAFYCSPQTSPGYNRDCCCMPTELILWSSRSHEIVSSEYRRPWGLTFRLGHKSTKIMSGGRKSDRLAIKSRDNSNSPSRSGIFSRCFLIEVRHAKIYCFKCVIVTDLNFSKRALLAEEVRDAVIRFQMGLSCDRHWLKSGSAVETKHLRTAQRFQERILK
jgi:hypothetical protein